MPDLLQSALWYARRGWKVFPVYGIENGACACQNPTCSSPGKHPLTPHGVLDASTDREQITQYWTTWPNANIGIATGAPSGLAVLDVDDRHGGEESFAELQAEYGPLDATVQALTGGGRHLYFRADGRIKTRAGIRPGIDVRGDGGYVVAPPSAHISGKSYTWEVQHRPDEKSLTPAPACLVEPNGSQPTVAGPLPETIPEGRRNDLMASLAGSMRRRGASVKSILSALRVENSRCVSPLAESELRSIAESIGQYRPEGETPDTKPKTRQKKLNLAGTVELLEATPELMGVAHFDEFHQKIFRADGSEWADNDALELMVLLQGKFRAAVSKQTVFDAAMVCANRHKTNEPLDWMNSLTWDGKPRIDEFSTVCLGVKDSAYAREVSRNFWLGMVARVYRPGCDMRNVIVLEGPQNAGKSRALAAIGGKWAAESLESITAKDFFIGLHGKLLIEIAEWGSFSKAEAARIKQGVSCPSDRLRMPYDRYARDYPRRCTFAATTNEATYLTDHTGNSRFFPLRCGAIYVDLIRELRDQFFAEAVALYKADTHWWNTPQEAEHEQEERRTHDSWEEAVKDYLVGRSQTTMGEILSDGVDVPIKDHDRSRQNRVGKVLRVLGWSCRVVWADEKAKRVWIRE